MIITRKIEVYVSEEDKDQKKEFIKTIYDWSSLVRKAANIIVAHKFVQQNIRDFVYIKDDIQDKFYVSDILREGKGMSEQNVTYRVVSELLKGKMPSDIYSCLNQAVAKTFKETLPDMLKGKTSVRSYKDNIPMPFSAKTISNIHKAEDGHFYFTLFGIPFTCRLGRDRSNNEAVIDRCIEGEYKICSSSLQVDRKRNKMFLLLCVDMPKKEVKVEEKKILFAYLDVETPIVCSTDVKAKNGYDSRLKWFEIGNKEEYLHRRIQIQAAVRRCQINNRYTNGGHGRKKKCKALDRWHEIETNYVNTKLHTYSRILVDTAIKNKCGTIMLLNQKPREDKAKELNEKGNEFLLRNWGYYGLKEKISYKAKMVGIKVTEDVKA